MTRAGNEWTGLAHTQVKRGATPRPATIRWFSTASWGVHCVVRYEIRREA